MENKQIIKGNCIEIFPLIEDNEFDDVFTSPPYNRKRNDTYAKFNDINNDYYQLLRKVTEESLRIAKNNIIINVQTNMYNKKDVLKWLADFADYYKGTVVWCKKNPTPSWNFKKEKNVYSVTNAVENFYIFGKNNTAFEANNKIFNFIISNVNSKHFTGHGAVMKLEIAEWFIRNFTKKDEFVFDPFFGCGTTGVACTHLGRRWGGVELVDEYIQIAEKRIKEESNTLFEGKEAETEENVYVQIEKNFL